MLNSSLGFDPSSHSHSHSSSSHIFQGSNGNTDQQRLAGDNAPTTHRQQNDNSSDAAGARQGLVAQPAAGDGAVSTGPQQQQQQQQQQEQAQEQERPLLIDLQKQQAIVAKWKKGKTIAVEWARATGQPTTWTKGTYSTTKYADRLNLRAFGAPSSSDIILRIPTVVDGENRNDNDIIIRSITIRNENCFNRPTNLRTSSILPTAPTYLIYVDGGTQQSQRGAGPTGAAVVVCNQNTREVEEHSWFSLVAMSNIAEWIAFVAGMRVAKKLAERGETVLVIGDSENIYKAWADGKRPTAQHLVKYYDTGKSEASQTNNIFTAHMFRSQGNPADDAVKDARTRGGGIGDQSLFMQVHSLPHTNAPPGTQQLRQQQQQQQHHSSISDAITQIASTIRTVQQFAEIRRFHARAHVPEGAVSLWTQIVKSQITQTLHAPDIEQRSVALIGLLTLPALFLAQNASQKRILDHLQRGIPFQMTPRPRRNQDTAPSDNNSKTRDEAKGRRVANLVKNFRTRSAVNMMQSDAAMPGLTEAEQQMSAEEQDEASKQAHRETVEKLRRKFPAREAGGELGDVENCDITPFDSQLVMEVVGKMSRGAATAIDGWTRDQLLCALKYDPSIAEDLGVLLSHIIMAQSRNQQQTRYFTKWAMDIVRAGRLVAIPKPSNDIRPIVISCFFAKLAGAIVLKRGDVKQLPHQYAIQCPNGAQRIVHKVRQHYDKNMAIIRIDLRNAYNAVKRKLILERLIADFHEYPDLLQYFLTMYSEASSLIVYGPGGTTDIVDAPEGVRQGDACSSYFFCLVLTVGIKVQQKFGPDVESFLYMDDGTFVAKPEIANEAAAFIIEQFKDLGFAINLSKSSMICRRGRESITTARDSAPAIEIFDEKQQEFKVLGSIINDQYEQMNNKLVVRTDRFFDSLDSLSVHPEIKHTILWFCGRPKLIYFCSTTPPDRSRRVVQHFQQRINQSFANLIDVDLADIEDKYMHAVEGAGIPDYRSNAEALYVNSRTAAIALNDPKQTVSVRLTNYLPNGEAISPAETSLAYSWTRYMHPTSHGQLVPNLYVTALALRCNVIPRVHVRDPKATVSCCGHVLETPQELINHALRCESLAHIHHATRHNWLKYALASAARQHGIHTAIEPNFYVYVTSATHHRPDITFYPPGSNVPIVTDCTVVAPQDGAPVGTASARAASKKRDQHEAATARAGHKFYAFAMETNGRFDNDCDKMIRHLANTLAPHRKNSFIRDMHGAAATAIARFRAQAVINALTPDYGASRCM